MMIIIGAILLVVGVSKGTFPAVNPESILLMAMGVALIGFGYADGK